MNDLREQIALFNKWHLDPDYRFQAGSRYRDLYDNLVKNYLDKEISISISGLRRVGKTTILYQLINHLLNSKVDSKHIFYFQFSEKLNNLKDVLDIFFLGFNENDIEKDNFYIFLDELQYVENWQNLLKDYIDRNKRIKFIVTGSASVYFRSKVKESLAGRILDFVLSPLSFSEMIRLKEGYQMKYSFGNMLKDDQDKFEKLLKLQNERSLYKKFFRGYLSAGEFPALLEHLEDQDYYKKYLMDGIIEKILLKDIKLFEVEKQEEITALFKICCSNCAQMINLKNISSETGLAYQTIKKYLSVLKKTYLITSVKNRLRSVRAQIKSLDKIFSLSTNLNLAMLSIEDPLNPPYLDFKGHLIENFVFNSIKNMGDTYYYNKSGKEVDLILESENKIFPFEVKSKSVLKKTDFNHLLYFMDKNNLNQGFMVYGGQLGKYEIDKSVIYLIPYWLF